MTLRSARRSTSSIVASITLAAALMILPSADAAPPNHATELAAVDDPPVGTGLPSHPVWTGLPDYVASNVRGTWIGTMNSGLNYIGAAEQWARLPNDQAPAYNLSQDTFVDPNCRRGGLIGGQYREYRNWTASIFLRSGLGEDVDGFGTMGPFTVRTLAFGSVPVEATVSVHQLRDDNDVLIPIDFVMRSATYCPTVSPFPGVVPPGGNSYQPVDAAGQVRVQIDEVRVDSVPLGLRRGCATSTTASLQLTSKPWYEGQPESWGVFPSRETRLVTPHYNPGNGGLLRGTIDVPAFAGCLTTGGDDVSALLTSAVSGPENAIELRNSGLDGSCESGDLSDPCSFDFRLPPLDMPEGTPED